MGPVGSTGKVLGECVGGAGTGAGSRDRTGILSLEGCCTTIVLYPRCIILPSEFGHQSSANRVKRDTSSRRSGPDDRCGEVRWWRGLDSNQRRHSSADLQSAAIDRSATPPTDGHRPLRNATVRFPVNPVRLESHPGGQNKKGSRSERAC